MEKSEGVIVSNYFVLGQGPEGTYSDITIRINIRSDSSSLKRGADIEMKDEELLARIESQLNSWIESYTINGIYMEIIILDIGIDESGRLYAVENSIGGLMHDALPQIGIKPPQIFGL